MSLNLSGSTGISGVDGSAGTPAIQGTDANTGISFPAADTVAINTGGNERSRVDSSGRLLAGTSTSRNVGLSTSYPSKLQLETTNYAAASFVNNSNDVQPAYLTLGKSRGGIGSNTIVQSGDVIGHIGFAGADGTDIETLAAHIQCAVDGTPGTNDMPGRLVFSTTADGASSPTERLRIRQDGLIAYQQGYTSTTANAANLHIFSDGVFYRSTSSAKYKTQIETIEDSYSDAILQCRPVWYRSTSKGDNPNYGWWGFIAEEVAEIDPRLVHWKTTEVTYEENGSAVQTPCEPEPEGVAYDRFVPHLLNLIKRQKEQIEALEARLTAAGI